MDTWIGTSGFQYPEWKGNFYPEKLSTAKMLTYYASVFGTTEVNYTFRSMPSEKTVQRWRDETPANFRFSLKAPQRVTHFAKLNDCSVVMADFHKAVVGLGEKMGPVLFQLPPTFRVDAVLLRDFLSVLPKGLRAAFEFRHESWLTDEVFSVLEKGKAALCIAESEDFETPAEVTAKFGYLRLRREDYTAPQIKKWAKIVKEQSEVWSEVFVYFKHEETCVGPGFAQAMLKAMGE